MPTILVLGGVNGLAFDTQATALHNPLLGGHVVAELLETPHVFPREWPIKMGRSAMEKRGVFRKLSWEWTYDDIWIYFFGGDITVRYLGITFLDSNLAMNNRKSTSNIN